MKVPTSDPLMPMEVLVAKQAFCKIRKKADIGDGMELLDVGTGTFLARLVQVQPNSNSNDFPVDDSASEGYYQFKPPNFWQFL